MAGKFINNKEIRNKSGLSNYMAKFLNEMYEISNYEEIIIHHEPVERQLDTS